MLVEAELVCPQTVAVQYLLVPPPAIEADIFDVSSMATATPIQSPVFGCSELAGSVEFSRSESALSCSTSIQNMTIFETLSSKFAPGIRSGSHTDIGPRKSNEDQHIRIDDLSTYLGSLYGWSQPSSFYAVFDGHGGPHAAAYVKNNAMRFFFEEAELPQISDIDEKFLQDLESSHRRSFLLADRALADEQSCVDPYCGTTALTALFVGRHLLIANAGDCRAVLCRKGDAVQLSRDHRTSCQMERKRVKDLGGKVDEFGYLNGELAVTRALGDWYMKLPFGSASPLTAEPEILHFLLTEGDEFLIIGCDGIWDVLSNKEAVALVRGELRLHNDPQQCAIELINLALMKNTCDDNLTAIVVCLSSPEIQDSVPSRRPRLRCCTSEEERNKFQSLLEGN